MSRFGDRNSQRLSTSERAIVGIHLAIAALFAILGLVGARDPGWADVQRFVVIMFVGVWILGVLIVGVLTRFVDNQRSRYFILLSGPVLAIVLVLGWVRLSG
ncbi:MAG: hypothetical protein KJN81_05515 [Acidimicrobiia bacterium]|nr:hypothetical protein [Acidimicrobiia bacterium]NNC44034.1 hypothetical protein [Acidimicrobiia bacterium]NNL27872.1 hypothetical protein [Acidimicrobiia bacterium]NNL48279.1 hypothetical protein [Acidimicrobiia bacterium]